jgi:hypothetical protein
MKEGSMRRRLITVALLVLTIVAGYLVGCASTGQPHMNAALDELRSAKSELDSANSDKGGHRVKALDLVNEAIAEVEAGIDYARSH